MKAQDQTRSPMQVLKDQRERVSEAYAMAKRRQTVFGQGDKDESIGARNE